MLVVRAAIAARTTSGAVTAKSSRWCSPTPKKASPSSSASTAWSTMLRITWSYGSGVPSASNVTSPKVSSPSSRRAISAHLGDEGRRGQVDLDDHALGELAATSGLDLAVHL